jgi:predicted naringenin-chalcone synthase
MVVPVIVALGRAQPPSAEQGELWEGFFAERFAGPQRAFAQRIFANAGVSRRCAAVNPLLEDVSDWPTSRRMRRYMVEAVPLGKDAVSRALASAGLRADEIGMFIVCSCTGYATPGLDLILARDLGMAPDTQRLFIGHMGCYAALPGLRTAADYVRVHQRPAVLLCAELTSLHIQPFGARMTAEQIVSHALFSDAAVAVVCTPGGTGYAVQSVESLTDAATADHMTWDLTDTGFRMSLSIKVPDVLAENVRHLVVPTLAAHGITDVRDVDGWAVHPGGPRILTVVEQQLGLPPDALTPSRRTLAEDGNCSSATVLLILDRLLRSPQPTRQVAMLAFGPGLTLYAGHLTSTS